MAPIADMWCFEVDAKFERNGMMSSNTLKCVHFSRVAFPRVVIPSSGSSSPPMFLNVSPGWEVGMRHGMTYRHLRIHLDPTTTSYSIYRP